MPTSVMAADSISYADSGSAVLPVSAIVLAAGKSTRMGRPKPTLPLPGNAHHDVFLTRILRTLADAAVTDVVVVLGHEPEPIRREVSERGFAPRFVINDAYETGQLSSWLSRGFGRSTVPFGHAAHARGCAARFSGDSPCRDATVRGHARADRALREQRPARTSSPHRAELFGEILAALPTRD
jgi:CTP:molybdopterin cytidylyltransferase MocA